MISSHAHEILILTTENIKAIRIIVYSMTHDKRTRLKKNHNLLSVLLIFNNLYEKRDELSFSEAYKNSGLKLVPSFIKYLQAMERYDLINRSLNSHGEATWQITVRGREILKKFANMLKELKSIPKPATFSI